MKIAIASDHAGFKLKNSLINWLGNPDIIIIDFGTFSSESVDYPDYGYKAAEVVAKGKVDYGILICGTGIGMCMIANKIKGILAANCTTPEIARLAREHNNANVLTLGARFLDFETAKKIVVSFIEGVFQEGRHINRLEKIHSLTGC